MILGTWGLTNSIRPLSTHTTRSPILAPDPAQKLSLLINVQLVVGQEVFGRHHLAAAFWPPTTGLPKTLAIWVNGGNCPG